jgi:O-antigen ligase
MTHAGTVAVVSPAELSRALTYPPAMPPAEADRQLLLDNDAGARLESARSKRALRDPPGLRAPRGARIASATAIAYIAALPLLKPTGPFNTSPVDIAGLILVVAVAVASRTKRLRVQLPYAVPIAIFALAGTLGALAGPVPAFGLTAVVQDVILLSVCGAIATIAHAAQVKRLLMRTWAIAGLCWAAMLVVGVVTHVTALSGGGIRYGARASLTTGDPNLAANYLVVSMFMLYAARWPARPVRRVGASLVLLAAILLTGSNGAIIAVVIGALVSMVAAICIRTGWRLFPGLVALGAFGVLLMSIAPVARWQQDIVTNAQASSIPIVRDSFGREDQSSSTRHTLLDESIKLFHSDGALGTGPASTKHLLAAGQFPYQKEAHDDYMAALTERGALGVLGLALLIGAAARRVSAVTQVPRSSGQSVMAPAPVVGCAVALATSGLFYEILHFRQLWVFLALIATAPRAKRS